MIAKLEDIAEPERIPKLTIVDKFGEVKMADARRFFEKRDDFTQSAYDLMIEIS